MKFCDLFKKVLLLICSSQFFLSSEAATEKVVCDKIENYTWSVGEQKTCYMESNATMIDADNFVVFPSDFSIKGISFEDNKKISFLPIKMSETFPDLLIYYAPHCSIKSVSFENFKSLKRVREVYLYNNQIERINTNTFQDLISLEYVSLCRFVILLY